MTIITTQLTWEDVIGPQKQLPYFQQTMQFVRTEIERGKTIYPSNPHIFNALKQTPFADVKVVIIGQDPYHGPGQAHGLSFSVPEGINLPPSLINIFKALCQDLDLPNTRPDSGDLTAWAQQGVLLLNTVLTVEAHKPQSHANLGWETFTDAIISALNEHHQHLVFLCGVHTHAKKGRTSTPTNTAY